MSPIGVIGSILLVQTLWTTIVAIPLGIFLPYQHAMSFVAGSALVGANWIFLGVGWAWVIGKKSIALATTVIVIKYALFGTVCFLIARQPWISPGWLVGGVSMIIPTVLWMARKQSLMTKDQKKKEMNS